MAIESRGQWWGLSLEYYLWVIKQYKIEIAWGECSMKQGEAHYGVLRKTKDQNKEQVAKEEGEK